MESAPSQFVPVDAGGDGWPWVSIHVMNLITIRTAFNPADAHLVRSRLEAAGFHPFVAHELSALSMDGYSMAAGGIRVQVPEDEADEARQFLDHSRPAEPPDDDVATD